MRSDKMEKVQKVCPVVLRSRNGGSEILAFRHPQAGCQIVKGTVEPGEPVEVAAARELFEESGVKAAKPSRLGQFPIGTPPTVWHFFLFRLDELPEEWCHMTMDDGGHEFRFFWHPLDSEVGEEWEPIFKSALLRIRLLLRQQRELTEW